MCETDVVAQTNALSRLSFACYASYNLSTLAWQLGSAEEHVFFIFAWKNYRFLSIFAMFRKANGSSLQVTAGLMP